MLCGLHMEPKDAQEDCRDGRLQRFWRGQAPIWRNGDPSAASDLSELPLAPLLVVSGTTDRAELLSKALQRAGPASRGPTVTLVIPR